MIYYELDEDIGAEIKEIIRKLDMTHIDESLVVCIRSRGSSSKRTLARCHGLPRIMQRALDLQPHYVIEIISEQFDKLDKANKTKVLIHELMHIPHTFGGGFRSHLPYVTKRKVEKMYRQFIKAG